MAAPGKKTTKSLKSLPSSIKSTTSNLKVYCQPCNEEGTKLPAQGYCTDCKEHLCKDCFKFHKKNKLSKQHTLLDATRMPRTLQQSSTDNHTAQLNNLTTSCVKHPKETIKFYCTAHKELLCSVCVTVDHQSKSCKVSDIADVSGDIIDSKEYEETMEAANNCVDIYTNITKDVKKMTEKSNTSLKLVLADIKMFRDNINKKFDELEKQAENVAKKTEEDNTLNLRTLETTSDTTIKPLTALADKLKQLNSSKQTDQLFIELKLAEKTIKDIQEKIPHLTSHDINEHFFKPNETILALLKTENCLGTLTQKPLNTEFTVPMKSKQATHEGDIFVKTPQEKKACWISGMTFLTPDLLVITDCINKTVKMVNISSQSVIDQSQLDAVPWDVTKVSNTQVVVTLCDKKSIQFLSISLNKLKQEHRLKVGRTCYGISCHQDKLVVSYCDFAKLQILDMNGNLLLEIDRKDIFRYPCFVISNSTCIYVSDCIMKTVTKLNWQGEVIGSYNKMAFPNGMALSDTDMLFVCDRNRNTIDQLSGDCSSGTTLLSNVTLPHAVCWCDQTSKLYYSSYDRYKEDNFLHVYKLSKS